MMVATAACCAGRPALTTSATNGSPTSDATPEKWMSPSSPPLATCFAWWCEWRTSIDTSIDARSAYVLTHAVFNRISKFCARSGTAAHSAAIVAGSSTADLTTSIARLTFSRPSWEVDYPTPGDSQGDSGDRTKMARPETRQARSRATPADAARAMIAYCGAAPRPRPTNRTSLPTTTVLRPIPSWDSLTYPERSAPWAWGCSALYIRRFLMEDLARAGLSRVPPHTPATSGSATDCPQVSRYPRS